MTEELTPKQHYYRAMAEYLKARGEIEFKDKGYKEAIAGKDTIIKTQILLLPEFGFLLEQWLDHDNEKRAFVTTELEHERGYTRTLVQELKGWVQYPEGHDKQYNIGMDTQAAKTYIERNHLCDLLYIAQGFNPEQQWHDKELKTGNITLVSEDQIKELGKALDGNVKTWNKIQRLYKIKEVSQLKESDFEDAMKYTKGGE